MPVTNQEGISFLRAGNLRRPYDLKLCRHTVVEVYRDVGKGFRLFVSKVEQTKVRLGDPVITSARSEGSSSISAAWQDGKDALAYSFEMRDGDSIGDVAISLAATGSGCK